jgi:hypothetical protein
VEPLVRRVDILAADPPDLLAGCVCIRWQVQCAPRARGFRVYRESTNQGTPPALLTPELIEGEGLLVFKDEPLPSPGIYRYWIVVIGEESASEEASDSWLDPLTVRIVVPTEELLGVFPNPSPGRFHLVYTRDTEGPTSLELFDATGRVMGRLVREDDPAGRVAWEISDLSSAIGGDLASGVYYARLRLGNQELPARLVLRRGK